MASLPPALEGSISQGLAREEEVVRSDRPQHHCSHGASPQGSCTV